MLLDLLLVVLVLLLLFVMLSSFELFVESGFVLVALGSDPANDLLLGIYYVID